MFIQCNRIKYLPELFQQHPNYSNTTCFLPILLLLLLLIFWFIYFTGWDVWVCRQVEMRGPLSGDCSLLTSGRSRHWTQVFGTTFLSLLKRLLSNFHFLYYYYFWIIIWGHLVFLTWTQLQEHSLKHGQPTNSLIHEGKGFPLPDSHQLPIASELKERPEAPLPFSTMEYWLNGSYSGLV